MTNLCWCWCWPWPWPWPWTHHASMRKGPAPAQLGALSSTLALGICPASSLSPFTGGPVLSIHHRTNSLRVHRCPALTIGIAGKENLPWHRHFVHPRSRHRSVTMVPLTMICREQPLSTNSLATACTVHVLSTAPRFTANVA
ncbi:hypothetical protein BGW36DRAFT_36223 [Talaromyces proteolyticus]|uniref:Secreted protein n=1 Tax=Talaromyces proteolyticus TaxID=1131652 RepID=A0AAD4PX74_9EURO|nr:uncharacterized protein BGW36DRAFT_36223 [Talaromyces proteolyticus]KAH8693197.1 hypothetical protein BGW36DRAFT_36223 [Talaromyces proteolyticus]